MRVLILTLMMTLCAPHGLALSDRGGWLDDFEPWELGPAGSPWVTVGLAAAVVDGDVGSLGIEASLTLWPKSVLGLHWGVSADMMHDFTHDQARPALGVFLGYEYVGVEVGGVLDAAGGQLEFGSYFRPYVSLGVASLWTRVSKVGDNSLLDFGLSLKIPLNLLWK